MSKALPTLENLLQHLEARGAVFSPEDRTNIFNAIEKEEAKKKDDEEVSYYIQGLVGFSAWLASLFLIGFMAMFGLLNSAASAVVFGALFCFGAVGFRFEAAKHSLFLGQIAYALGFAGQFLLIGGVAGVTESATAVAVAIVLLEGILFLFYREISQRVISILAIINALVFLAYDLKIPHFLHLLILGMAWANYSFFSKEKSWNPKLKKEFFIPLKYGLPLGLFNLIAFSIGDPLKIQYWMISTIALLAVLLWTEYDILKSCGLTTLDKVAPWLAGTVVFVFPTIQTPGIFAALLILLLGFYRGQHDIILSAVAFLIFFVGLFYYELKTTLLMKSLILMGSGAIFLVLRYVLFTELTVREKEE